MIIVLCRTPATGLLIIANGVTSRLAASIPWTRPGAGLCIKGVTASGVLSRGVKPVPPVVTIRFMKLSLSVQAMMAFCISSLWSGTIFMAIPSEIAALSSLAICHFPPPSFSKTSSRAAAALSVLGSLNAVSEIIRMAAFSNAGVLVCDAIIACGEDRYGAYTVRELARQSIASYL